MAKNLMNSISFSVLLLVLLMASNGILKSEALDCPTPGVCSLASQRVFLGECGLDPYTGTDAECCTCCKDKYKTSPNVPCWAKVEGTIKHCHCYRKV